jgi:hypothetical protein
MRNAFSVLSVLVFGLWFGGLILLFILVQTLFNTDRAMAERTAPLLFITFERYQFALIAAALVIFAAWAAVVRSRMGMVVFGLICGAILLALLSSLFITPRLEWLRQEGRGGSPEFMRLHGWSMMVYSIQALLLLMVGILLPLTMRTEARRTAGETALP